VATETVERELEHKFDAPEETPDPGPTKDLADGRRKGSAELQDAVVAEERLTMLVRRGRLPGEAAFVAGKLACLADDARSDARDRWPAEWQAARQSPSELVQLISQRERGSWSV